MRILVIEDDNLNRKMIEILMQSEGHEVDAVDNPMGALELIARRPPHLMLLDINFDPRHRMNGFDLFERVKAQELEIPVIIMTSRDQLEDKLRGFELGADDYITKPYSPAEVAARVKRVLTRVYKSAATQPQQLRFEGIELSLTDLTVTLNGHRTITLTPTEKRLLLYLMRRPDQVVMRDDLLEAVWGDGYAGESNVVDSYIRKLRRKIESDPANPRSIRTVRGYGYKFATKS